MQILVMRFKKDRKVKSSTLLSNIKKYTTLQHVEYNSMDYYLMQMTTEIY